MSSKAYKINPNKWVDKYSDYLFNYAIGRVNNRDIAKDLISETFLAGLKAKRNFKGNATERTWLVAILKRKIIDYYRKINSKKGKAEVKINYNQSGREGDWLEEQVAAKSTGNAEDKILNTELREAIFTCLDEINPKHAKIFKEKTIDNRPTKVICNEHNITASNLWVIIHRARTALAACLEEKWLN
ncbi:sigma-70 family RNA polymerase sigma factor [Haloflavibacter putidus]|uniref:Sigma-70 family RNA polymerase sigma factor n=1 Tax=Haloflavibacter putidus TaxID=2576776 RepID=A0A507ZA17_9FLAO|nr:sigma-70 family RNA polymerase sigma factor [Haloflavibacter putidus]TQD34370.1 sigma-70 family RNA polymerase sigma factor [Haloflavibacter putidus]